MLKQALLTLGTLAVLKVGAMAQSAQDFDFENDTRYEVYRLYVSPHGYTSALYQLIPKQVHYGEKPLSRRIKPSDSFEYK
jgi:hypothetical protein